METQKSRIMAYSCHGQEVAVKKMKSSKSKEFLAELNVLCRIHHINVVSFGITID